MGFRYRKSINIGGGFRINLSKSGIGYSFGGKGYRVTKTAKGTIRKTISIPGTGISYVTENKSNKSKKSSNQKKIPYDECNKVYIENHLSPSASSTNLIPIINAAKRLFALDKIATVGLCLSLIPLIVLKKTFIAIICLIAFGILKLYAKKLGLIKLDYSFDDKESEEQAINKDMKDFLHLINCDKVWRLVSTAQTTDSGRNINVVNRIECSKSTKIGYPFKTDMTVASLKTANETLYFLPDQLLVINGKDIFAFDNDDIEITKSTTKFIEDEDPVPNDAKVIDTVWLHQNKNGGPDRRYKNNKEVPICLYGEITIKSDKGLNIVLIYSKLDSEFQNI